MPLGAFCGSDELLGCLAHDPPLGHITTFGGHPLSCAAGAAALQVIVDERLFERARQNGAILLEWLRNLVGDEITDVRGIGLLLGIEFAEAAIARRFVAETIARGVVVNWTLNADRVVRLAPPLTIEIDELRFALGAMEEALDAVQRNPRETQNG
jgi:acetylornithine/succinyldiaminopimelate/putrescine aminotransferase